MKKTEGKKHFCVIYRSMTVVAISCNLCALFIYHLSPLLLHFKLNCLSGHQWAKNNPHLPTTQEKPFEVAGVFLFLPFLPSTLQTLYSELSGEELQRWQAERSKQRGRMGGSGERHRELRNEGGRLSYEEERTATIAQLHYVIFLISVHHFLSFLFITAFTVGQLLETRHQSISN